MLTTQTFKIKYLSQKYSTVHVVVKKGRVIQNNCATKWPIILDIKNV